MFEKMGLHERLCRVTSELEFTTPTPIQQAAIPEILAGKDVRALAKTGSGKTPAFVLPMLHRLYGDPKPHTATRALILLPTRELAQQTLKQVETFARYTFIKAELITGGEDFKRQASQLRRNPDIVIGTPGRILEHLQARSIALQDLEILVLDEADRMLDLGFADDVLAIVQESAISRQSLMFSATFGSAKIRKLADDILQTPVVIQLDKVRGAELDNIQQQYITADATKHKERLLQNILANDNYQQAIVFTNTREQAERLGGVLLHTCSKKNYVLHGEKDHKDRKQIMLRFRNGEIGVLIATDVAARGIDVPDVQLVVNFDFPRRGEDYLHRIGRTGRAGAEGTAISFVTSAEWNLKAGIERYLQQTFQRRVIAELKGDFQGPKKLKASGKAASSKKKKPTTKNATGKSGKPATSKGRAKPTPVANPGGSAPLKRKKAP